MCVNLEAVWEMRSNLNEIMEWSLLEVFCICSIGHGEMIEVALFLG